MLPNSLPRELQLVILQKLDDKSLGRMLITCKSILNLADDTFYEGRMESRYGLTRKLADRRWTKSYIMLTSDVSSSMDQGICPVLVKKIRGFWADSSFALLGDGTLWIDNLRILSSYTVVDFLLHKDFCLFVATDEGEILHIRVDIPDISILNIIGISGIIKSIEHVNKSTWSMELLVLLDNGDLLNCKVGSYRHYYKPIATKIKVARFKNNHNFWLLTETGELSSTEKNSTIYTNVRMIQVFGNGTLAILKNNGTLMILRDNKNRVQLVKLTGRYQAIYALSYDTNSIHCYRGDGVLMICTSPTLLQKKVKIQPMSLHSAKIMIGWL